MKKLLLSMILAAGISTGAMAQDLDNIDNAIWWGYGSEYSMSGIGQKKADLGTATGRLDMACPVPTDSLFQGRKIFGVKMGGAPSLQNMSVWIAPADANGMPDVSKAIVTKNVTLQTNDAYGVFDTPVTIGTDKMFAGFSGDINGTAQMWLLTASSSHTNMCLVRSDGATWKDFGTTNAYVAPIQFVMSSRATPVGLGKMLPEGAAQWTKETGTAGIKSLDGRVHYDNAVCIRSNDADGITGKYLVGIHVNGMYASWATNYKLWAAPQNPNTKGPDMLRSYEIKLVDADEDGNLDAVLDTPVLYNGDPMYLGYSCDKLDATTLRMSNNKGWTAGDGSWYNEWLGQWSNKPGWSAWAISGYFADDAATSIDEIKAQQAAMTQYYDLSGRRVVNPEHGLYIKVMGNEISKVAL